MGERIDIMWLSINIRNKSRQWIRARVTALSVVESMRPKQRRRRCSPTSVLAAEEVQELVDLLAARQVFCEEVRWVDLTPYLADLDRSRPHFLLDPQSVSLEMTELAEA